MNSFSLTRDGFAFGQVIPNRDDGGRENFCNHVIQAGNVDEKPHAKLIEPQADDARPEKNYRSSSRLLLRIFENVNDTQPIIEHDRYAEGNRRRVKIVDARKFREREEYRVVHKERHAAHEAETNYFQHAFSCH